MMMEFLLGVWFMNQRQGLLVAAPSDIATITSPPVTQVEGKPYTRVGSYKVLERIPHETNAFTQGLVMIADTSVEMDSNNDGEADLNNPRKKRTPLKLYEGTGMYGSSQLRQIDIPTGNVLALLSLDKSYFGEGIAHFRDTENHLHIIQLTWKRQRVFEYIFDGIENQLQNSQTSTLLPKRITGWRFHTSTDEGWGITYSPINKVFYVSDGSEYIHVWNAETKREVRKFKVEYRHPNMATSSSIKMINELEWDPSTNTILANVWREDIILRINPDTGFVDTMYDMQNLLPRQDRTWRTDVLNGIALTYDSTKPTIDLRNNDIPSYGTDEVWVTGKYWPYMFRVQLSDNECKAKSSNDDLCVAQ
jgi:glutaminyl-peptide cyclotransferase